MWTELYITYIFPSHLNNVVPIKGIFPVLLLMIHGQEHSTLQKINIKRTPVFRRIPSLLLEQTSKRIKCKRGEIKVPIYSPDHTLLSCGLAEAASSDYSPSLSSEVGLSNMVSSLNEPRLKQVPLFPMPW